METSIYILTLIPISFFSLACQFLAIMDLFNREKSEVWGGSLWVWSIFILLGGIFGTLLYLGVGRVRNSENQFLNQGEQN